MIKANTDGKQSFSLEKVLKIAGIVVLVLLLAFGGLVAYAYYTYKKDNSRTGVWYYVDELPLTPDQYTADFDEIHQIVVDNYSLYRQKGLDMDSLYRVLHRGLVLPGSRLNMSCWYRNI